MLEGRVDILWQTLGVISETGTATGAGRSLVLKGCRGGKNDQGQGAEVGRWRWARAGVHLSFWLQSGVPKDTSGNPGRLFENPKALSESVCLTV